MIDKFAERGLRSLAVAYQVISSHTLSLVVLSTSFSCLPCFIGHVLVAYFPFYHFMHRKFQMEGRRAREGLGNLLASCLCLTRLDMIVQRQLEGHWTLGLMLRWLQVHLLQCYFDTKSSSDFLVINLIGIWSAACTFSIAIRWSTGNSKRDRTPSRYGNQHVSIVQSVRTEQRWVNCYFASWWTNWKSWWVCWCFPGYSLSLPLSLCCFWWIFGAYFYHSFCLVLQHLSCRTQVWNCQKIASQKAHMWNDWRWS